MLLFSGHKKEDALQTQGVALMLSKTAQIALIGWEDHGPRLLVANFRTNVNQSICHSPTNESEEEEKDEFYDRLLALFRLAPGRTS